MMFIEEVDTNEILVEPEEAIECEEEYINSMDVDGLEEGESEEDVVFKSQSEVSKYLKKCGQDILSGMSAAEEKTFIDGARWMFSMMYTKENRLQKRLEGLMKRLLKQAEELNEYRELYDVTYTVPKKKKGKKKQTPSDDFYDYDDNDEYGGFGGDNEYDMGD